MKKYFIILATLVFSAGLFAQISVDPQHVFYTDSLVWESRGVIKNLPPLRPYSVDSVKNILNSVLENGNEADKVKAELYWKEISGRPLHAEMKIEDTLNPGNDESKNMINVVPELNGELSLLNEKFSLGYKVGFVTRTEENENVFLPYYRNSLYDAKFDPAEVGPLYAFLNINNNFSYSINNFVFQTGIYKSGYGDFLNDGVALNDSAYHRPTFSLSYVNDFFSYAQAVSVIGATTNSGIGDVGSAKFMAFHAIDVKPFSWISGSFYESVVFGRRFDPSYLIPTPFMVSQSFSGYSDSIFMGAALNVNPVSGLNFKTDLFVDDLSVNDLVKLNFDSKNRVAWKNGVSYAPDVFWLDLVSLDYTIITPFTYSHWDFDNYSDYTMSPNTFNYQNYTNCGYAMGTNTPPNTDVIKLCASFSPVSHLKVNLSGSYTRHGNVCESLSDDEVMDYLISRENTFCTDGSIFTHPEGLYDSERGTGYFDTALNHLNFLTQDNLMSILQLSLDCDYMIFDEKWGNLSINLGYTFEFIHNKGVDSNMYKGLGDSVISNPDGTYVFGGQTYSSKEIVDMFKNQWKSSFKDIFNNFFRIGITYRF